MDHIHQAGSDKMESIEEGEEDSAAVDPVLDIHCNLGLGLDYYKKELDDHHKLGCWVLNRCIGSVVDSRVKGLNAHTLLGRADSLDLAVRVTPARLDCKSMERSSLDSGRQCFADYIARLMPHIGLNLAGLVVDMLLAGLGLSIQ